MNRFLATALIVCLVFASCARSGEKLPAEADIHKAIARSLPFVEKDGLVWMDRRECMSCHTVVFMLWAHHEAAAHGIAIDPKKVADWTRWSMDKSLAARVFFKLEPKTELPEPIKPKLDKLVGEGFTHEKDFVAALARAITPEALKQHRAELVKKATAKLGAGNDGGGLDTMVQLLLARDHTAKDRYDDFYASTAALIVRLQEPSGVWKAGGQLPARRWPKATADQTTTLWAILALAGHAPSTPAIQQSLEKAHAAVKKPASDDNLEWIVARLLYEQKFGTPDQFQSMKKQLLQRQHADGGWGALPGPTSEAFSTGQSLYALSALGVPSDDLAIRRGQKYLLDTQKPDGSWDVSPALTSNGGPPRLKKLEPIWRNWGTSWATIGLAKSLPMK